MWNNSSPREGYINNISQQYSKLVNQKSASKKELLALANKFKALKKEDDLFTTIANRTTSLANRATKLNLIKNLNWFSGNYEEFKELIEKEQG